MRSTPSVHSVVSEYLDVRRRTGIADSTVRGEKAVLERFGNTLNMQIGSITSKHVWDYFYGPGGMRDHHKDGWGRTVPPISESTHNLVLLRIRQFFDYAVRTGRIKRNPVTPEEGFRPLTVPKKNRQQPGPSVLLQLLDVAEDPMHRAYIATAINTGMRQVDLVQLRVGDVDLDGGWISAVIHKTKDADHVPITSDLDSEMRKWLTIYAQSLDGPLLDEHFLFPKRVPKEYSNDDRGHVRIVSFRYMPFQHVLRSHEIVQRAMAGLGLDVGREGTHTLRRAVARGMFDVLTAEGENDISALRTVSALLHHKSVATTERYLGLTTERARRDRLMRGRPFLSGMLASSDNVVPLHRDHG